MPHSFIFITVGFPFVDLRPFLSAPTHRLETPQFPLADAGAGEFIRSSGSIEKRAGGGIDEWSGEEVYSRATAAIRFPNRLEKRFDFSLKKPPHFKATYALRRFYSEGRVGRLEVGIRLNSFGRSPTPLNAAQCLELLRNTFAFQVRIPSLQRRTFKSSPLIEAGPLLADHYLRATTSRINGKFPDLEGWWLGVGDPLALFHYCPSTQVKELLPHSKTVQIAPDQDFTIAHAQVLHERMWVKTWMLGSDFGSERDRLRRLRIHLFRLHMEWEGLKEVLRRIKTRQLDINAGSSEELQHYLDDAITLMERRDRYGLDQSALIDSAKYLAELVTAGERRTILTELSKVRRNVLRKVERLTQESQGGVRANVAVVIQGSPNAAINIGELDLSNKSIKFGDNTSVTGPFTVTAADTIQRSFNSAVESNARSELKEELKKLAIQVAELAKQLPPDKAEEAARNLEDLTKEATSPQPKRRWYEFSGKGLIEAAETVGAIAAPVISTVKAILALLG